MALDSLLLLAALLFKDENAVASAARCADMPAAPAIPPSCPVTLAPEPPFVPPPSQPSAAPFCQTWYGSERLWTVLPRSGALYRGGHKVFWWSDDWDWRRDGRPKLTVSARRLDGEESEIRGSRATNAHAGDIGHAMLVGLTLPSAGCWEVKGEYQGTTLSFVAWVP